MTQNYTNIKGQLHKTASTESEISIDHIHVDPTYHDSDITVSSSDTEEYEMIEKSNVENENYPPISQQDAILPNSSYQINSLNICNSNNVRIGNETFFNGPIIIQQLSVNDSNNKANIRNQRDDSVEGE